MNRDRRFIFRLPGGARDGYLTMLMIAYMERRLNRHVQEKTGQPSDLPFLAFLKPEDIIMPDSVGAIIAGILYMLSAREGTQHMLNYMHRIIPPGRTLGGTLARRAFFRTARLPQRDMLGTLLQQSLGETSLRDFPTSLLITCLERYPAPNQVAFYLNLHPGVLGRGQALSLPNQKNGDSLLWQAIRASAAEPFFVGLHCSDDSLQADAAHLHAHGAMIRAMPESLLARYTYVYIGNGHNATPLPPSAYRQQSTIDHGIGTLKSLWQADRHLFLWEMARLFPADRFMIIDKNMTPCCDKERSKYPTDRSHDTSPDSMARMEVFHRLMRRDHKQAIDRLVQEIGDRHLGIEQPVQNPASNLAAQAFPYGNGVSSLADRASPYRCAAATPAPCIH